LQDVSDVVELASRLVAIPSVNGQEGALAAFLAEWLERAGLHVDLEEVAPGRPNVLAVWPAAGRMHQPWGLLFHAHTDTVPAHGMEDAFSGRVDHGYIWGRGAVDQKGGLAAAAVALATFAQSGRAASVPIGLAAVIDEESEHRGSMALAQSGLRAHRAIITEPSGLRVVLGCKGTVPLRVRVHGRAAHGARPWLGVNAVEKAMVLAQKVLDMQTPDTELAGLGTVRGTINLGVMQGGVAYNIVPDCCELWFDRRTVPGEDQAQVLAQVQAMIRDLEAQDGELRAEVEVARPDWHWRAIAERGLKPTLVPPDSDVVDWLAGHHTRILGSAPQRYFTDGYNEMDFLINDMSIPTVQYGPGDSQLCHTDKERLAISDLVTCTEVYLSLIEDVAGA
jgi:acetylornithine deacetylase/succinyl-diaminopimelate desuccinylase family protein